MAVRREKAEDIVMKPRQVEVLQGQGKSVSDAVRHIGVTEVTYYRWRSEYGWSAPTRWSNLNVNAWLAFGLLE